MNSNDLHGAFDEEYVEKRGQILKKIVILAIDAAIPRGVFVVDLGAGAYGSHVEWMRENGWKDAIGIDNTPNSMELSNGLVKVGDLTKPSIISTVIGRRADWIVSTDVGEHIPGEFSDIYLWNLATAGDGVLLSWSNTSRRGHGHISCRMLEWVACEMGSRGFLLDDVATEMIRRKLGSKLGSKWGRTLLIMHRRSSVGAR